MRKPSKEMKLEERIECVLCAQELELSGDAYVGKYELNDRKSITQFILGKLRKIYVNFATGDNITVSRRSAEKLATHSGEAYQKSLAHIPQIIENMQFLEQMKPSKENASFDNYSYYITHAKIDDENYTILSTVGRKQGEIYYDQNIFKGTPKEVFAEAKNETSKKYGRLREILEDIKEDS